MDSDMSRRASVAEGGEAKPDDGQGDLTLDVVRRLITEHEPAPVVVAPPAPEPAPEPEAVEPPVIVPLTRPVAVVAMSALDEDAFDAPDLEPDPEPLAEPGRLRLLLDRARRALVLFLKQPDAPRRLALGLIVIVAIVRPGYILGLTLLALAVIAITWFTLGPDRSAELIAAWHARLSLRDPDKAELIRQRAARVSKTLTAAVEKLPARWSAGFYLPDFEPEQDAPEKMNDDPFARIAAERRALDEEVARP